MKPAIAISSYVYDHFARRLLFRFDSELIHERLVGVGGLLGKCSVTRGITRGLFRTSDPMLETTVAGIHFKNPVGLAAGFDYRADLSPILPCIGFGFGTIGTITNSPYEGNPKPRLGRLPRSRSLLVNKGFKNDGIDATLEKLKRRHYSFSPSFAVGMSIGKTNTHYEMTQAEAVIDVVIAFKKAEASRLSFSYYELNISCPNLYGSATFYPPENLRALLVAVTALKLSRPLFIKMPIEKSDAETEAMLDIILTFPEIAGVIFGNLQKNRQTPGVVPEESAKYPVGHLSGLPTQKDSDRLIRLAYRKSKRGFAVIGCGGIFTAEDAYRKIRLGASLVQFITGLIYEGPQLAAQINAGLIKLLKKDGFRNVSEAVGKDA
jgi:dihydroorotate dehydrogenase subfamily 2